MLSAKLVTLSGITLGLSFTLAVAYWVSVRTSDEMRAASALPSPVALDSLSRYVTPAVDPGADLQRVYREPTPSLLGGEPLFISPPGRVPPRTPAAEQLRVSAILITDSRRVAVVNGRTVSVGDQLPGGRRVTAIEPDYVAIQESGRRRVLTLPGGR